MVPVCDKRYHIYNRFRHFWAEIKKLWNYPLQPSSWTDVTCGATWPGPSWTTSSGPRATHRSSVYTRWTSTRPTAHARPRNQPPSIPHSPRTMDIVDHHQLQYNLNAVVYTCCFINQCKIESDCVSDRQQIHVHLNSLIYISSNSFNRFAVYYLHVFL